MKDILKPYYDIEGRLIQAGDLLKIFHFRAYLRRRKVYMYKLVFAVDDNRKLNKDGKYLYAVDVGDIWKEGLDKAHKCPLYMLGGNCEIIDEADFGENICFWEREKRKKKKL